MEVWLTVEVRVPVCVGVELRLRVEVWLSVAV